MPYFGTILRAQSPLLLAGERGKSVEELMGGSHEVR